MNQDPQGGLAQPAGVIPLKNIANIVDAGNTRVAGALVALILVFVVGCFLLVASLVMFGEGAPAWSVLLVAVVVLAGSVVGIWSAVRRVQAGRRIRAPRIRGAYLVADRIDMSFSDGGVRTLSLHTPDLRLDAMAGSPMMPVDQTVLTGTAADAAPVAVVMVHKRRGLMEPTFRQPDRVLWGIANGAERSPYPAGRQAAERLRQFIGSPDS